MNRFLVTCRISLALVGAALIVMTTCVGFFATRTDVARARRSAICETTGLALSAATSGGDRAHLQRLIDNAVFHYDDLVSLRLTTQHMPEFNSVASQSAEEVASPEDRVSLPMYSEDELWGQLEFQFLPVSSGGFWQDYPVLAASALLAVVLFPVFAWYVHRLTSKMNAVAVVPPKVRSVLNTFAEGMAVLNDEHCIVLANEAFGNIVGLTPEELQGKKISTLGWDPPLSAGVASADYRAKYPWDRATSEMENIAGDIVTRTDGDSVRSFLINAAPVFGEAGTCSGVLLSVDDITQLQKKNSNLNRMLSQLESSREHFKKQNEELRILATRDPLTNCLNRRAFIEVFETHFETVRRYGGHLSLLLLDIDHFKSINDTYGHGVGDRVLKSMSSLLQQTLRNADACCRYGGEEFCVLLPHQDVLGATDAAERIRRAIAELDVDGLSVTVSIGVSSTRFGSGNLHEMVHQADEALYAAKRSGRNQVCAWNEIPSEVQLEEVDFSPAASRLAKEEQVTVSFHTVQAMYSMLLLRSHETAEHCRRVADLCAVAAASLMTPQEAYTLEVAGLLHEIGKIGLPDELLRRTSPMTDEERKIVEFYCRVGLDLVQSAFSSSSLDDTLSAQIESAESQTMSARLLLIADEFDRICFDHEGKRLMSNEDAFVQLRRLRAVGIEEALIEHFVLAVKERDFARREQLTKPEVTTASSFGQIQDKVVRELCVIRDEMREREMISESTLKMVKHL